MKEPNLKDTSNLPQWPNFLAEGDKIGIIAPAGPIPNQELFYKGITLLEEQGYRPIFHQGIFSKELFLAAPDHIRLQELVQYWRDPDIKAIMAARGGYGCLRLLPNLPVTDLCQKPKLFIGFSDISILLNSFCRHHNLVTLHAPMVVSLQRLEPISLKRFYSALKGHFSENLLDPQTNTVNPGQATGRLIGGNLASLVHLLGTPYTPEWEEALLFLEDVNEAPYRIDRMLTQLALHGTFSQIKGLILGDFTDKSTPIDSGWLYPRILELTRGAIPIIGNAPLGHGNRNHPLPVGAICRLDAENTRLNLI